MAKITRAQYEKWNSMAQNGFGFDLRYFAIWGEKQLRKTVELDGGDYIEFLLTWMDEYKEVTNDYGVTMNRATGKQVPTLHYSRWSPTGTEGVYGSSGLGKWIPVGDPQSKKSYAALCKLSATIDIEQYMAAYRDAA